MIRRFFDALATDAPAPVNVAELLAKQGIKTDDSTIEVPTINTAASEAQPQGPPTEPAPPPVETTKEQPAPEAPRPADQPPPQQPAAPEPVKPVEVDWREVLKKQPEVEVYKHLGLDDKMINFLSRWKGGESLKDYLEAATVDYTKLTPEQIMRHHLQKEYGGLQPEDFEELYRMKVIEQYKLDTDVFDEKDVRRGKLLLGVDADKIRQEMIKRQQDLLLSAPPAPEASGKSDAEIELERMHAEREQDVIKYKGFIEQDNHTKDLLSTKMFKLGTGDQAYNYEVQNPGDVLDVLYDPGKWAAKLFDANGQPNTHKHLLLGLIATDDNFLANYAKHHQMIGSKSVAEQIENASPPVGTPAKGNETPLNPAAELFRSGVITSGE